MLRCVTTRYLSYLGLFDVVGRPSIGPLSYTLSYATSTTRVLRPFSVGISDPFSTACLINPIEWMNVNLLDQAYWDSKAYGFRREVDIFMDLGNTGTAMHRSWQGFHKVLQTIEDTGLDIEHAHLEALDNHKPNAVDDLISLRHPDPALVTKQEIKDPRLQVMGSWKKITNLGKGISSRQGFSSFVWNSRLRFRSLSVGHC